MEGRGPRDRLYAAWLNRGHFGLATVKSVPKIPERFCLTGFEYLLYSCFMLLKPYQFGHTFPYEERQGKGFKAAFYFQEVVLDHILRQLWNWSVAEVGVLWIITRLHRITFQFRHLRG